MKKSYVSYVAPEVELVEMVVETGFAASLEGAGNEDLVDATYDWGE